jgi:hypothetical protein
MTDFYVESNSFSSREFKIVPVGNHLARLYRIVDLGTQTSNWDGQTKIQRKVTFAWEIHGEDDDGSPLLTEEGKPMAIFKNYTYSWNEAATLRKNLQAWRGEPWTDAEAKRFNLKNLLGQWCMLNVIHKKGKDDSGKMFANVDTISKVPPVIRKAGLPEGHNELQIFTLSNPDWEVFETFSKGLKAKIEASPEYRALANTGASGNGKKSLSSMSNDLDEDVPF